MTEPSRGDGVIGPPHAHVIETEIKGDISLFDAETNNVIVLNSTASDVWRLCDGEQTLEEIISLLAQAYQCPADRIRSDVTETMKSSSTRVFCRPHEDLQEARLKGRSQRSRVDRRNLSRHAGDRVRHQLHIGCTGGHRQDGPGSFHPRATSWSSSASAIRPRGNRRQGPDLSGLPQAGTSSGSRSSDDPSRRQTNRVAIEEYGGFAVHAGVVTKEGRTLAFPTRSGGGKSTLTAAFLLNGWDYVSDESLCVDLQRRLVRSYPKPLSLDYRSCELLGVSTTSLTVPATRESEGLARPADFNASLAPDRLDLTDVVLTEYGERVLDVTELAASKAMAALLEYSFNHFKLGEGAFHLAAALASQVRFWRLSYRIRSKPRRGLTRYLATNTAPVVHGHSRTRSQRAICRYPFPVRW